MASTFSSGLFSNQDFLLRKFLWCLILTTLVVVSIIIFPVTPTPHPAVDSKILALRYLLCVIGLASLANWKWLSAPRWYFTDTIFAALITVFMISWLSSGRIAYCFSISWQQAGLFFLGWIIYRLSPCAQEIRALLWLIGGLAFLASLYGFLTYQGYDILRPLYPFDFDFNQGGRNFIHSFYGNPEYYAGYVAPGAVTLFGLCLVSRSRVWVRALCFSTMIFVLGVMALSGSRSAFIGFLCATAILVLFQISVIPRSRRKIVYGAGVGFLLLGIAGVTILSTSNPLNPKDMRLAQRFGESFDTQSASFKERVLFYTSTSAALNDNPVWGTGPGTFRLQYIYNVEKLLNQVKPGIKKVVLVETNNKLAEHAHNDYLEIWQEQGFAGIAAFLLLIAHMVGCFLRTRFSLIKARMSAVPALSDYHLIFFCASLAMLINAMTSFPFHMSARSTLGWILMGTFFAIDAKLTHSGKAETEATTP